MSYDGFTFAVAVVVVDWKVTRSLVSYDLFWASSRVLNSIERSPDHWWVTTLFYIVIIKICSIERSPDHWWVTTSSEVCSRIHSNWKVTRSLVSYDLLLFFVLFFLLLKGHQIIGELRLLCSGSRFPSGDWKVTRSLVSYDSTSPSLMRMSLNWKVTRSLVSYDFSFNVLILFIYWKVTRSLVSYDSSAGLLKKIHEIERSPDHWWVTTHNSYSWSLNCNWKVTRSLVSYDWIPAFKLSLQTLKGHQIIGELRPYRLNPRPWIHDWKVTRSLVSYD